MTVPPEFRAQADTLPAALRALLDAELAAGNSVAEAGSYFPAPPAGAFFQLTRPVTTRPRQSEGGLIYRLLENSLHCGSYSDERGFYFILEPPLAPPPEPDMDAIREARSPEAAPPRTFSADPATAAGRFERSMEIDYSKWHDGEGYDLHAIAEATPADRTAIEAMLLPRCAADWRDVEALAALRTPAAIDALKHAWAHGPATIRSAIARHAPELIPEPERIRSLLEILETASLSGGLSQAIDQAEDFHPQPVIEALLRGTLRRSGEAPVHFAALLMFLHGKAESAFDWDQRPFFLRFLTPDRKDREAAFVELCSKIGVDPSPYL